MLNNLLSAFLKTITVTLLMANLSITNANNPWDPRIYGGLSLGGTSLQGKNSLSVNGQNVSRSANGSNVHGDLIGGYEISNKDMFVALEAHAGLSNLATEALLDLAGVQHPFTVESTHGFGIAVHAGKFIDENHRVYLKAGVDIRKFQVELQGKGRFTDHKKSFQGVGFVPGIGIEKKLNDTVSFRTEYKVSLYSPKKLASEHTNHTITPVTHHVSAGFHFKI